MIMCSHGLGELVTVRQRNIEEDSFPEEVHGKADALFLDLPRPWKVSSALKPLLAHMPSVLHAYIAILTGRCQAPCSPSPSILVVSMCECLQRQRLH